MLIRTDGCPRGLAIFTLKSACIVGDYILQLRLHFLYVTMYYCQLAGFILQLVSGLVTSSFVQVRFTCYLCIFTRTIGHGSNSVHVKDLLDEQPAGPMKNIRFTIQVKVHCPSHQSHNLKTNIGLERSLFRGSLPTLLLD